MGWYVVGKQSDRIVAVAYYSQHIQQVVQSFLIVDSSWSPQYRTSPRFQCHRCGPTHYAIIKIIHSFNHSFINSFIQHKEEHYEVRISLQVNSSISIRGQQPNYSLYNIDNTLNSYIDTTMYSTAT
jgi:hypothetical protein